jgi:hypothetical protein
MKKSILFIIIMMCILIATGGDLFAQRTAIKVEALTPHSLEKMGFESANGAGNVTSGLPVVGKGTWVYLSAWNVTGDTGFVPGSTYLWELVTRPANSAAVLDSTTMQWTSLHTDSAGTYTVRATVDGKDTSVNIIAANYTGADRNGVAGAPFNCLSCHTGATPEIVSKWSGSGHATMFENGMNNVWGDHWGKNCWSCHTVGYDEFANNGGFDDVAQALGFVDTQWTPWRAGLYDSLLTTGKAKLSMVAGIGCENCHGPKNPAHSGTGTQPKSMDFGVCAQCHDEPWRHNKVSEFENSVHAEAVWSGSFDSDGANPVTTYGLSTCIRCHDGAGFVAFTKGESFDNRISSGYGVLTHTKINCQTCHDPHDGSLRSAPTASDTLGNGYDYSAFNFGKGKICVNCHKYRRDAETYVNGNISSHFGPHHRGAADVILGQNGYTFGQTLTNSIGHRLVDDLCVGCHMSATSDTGTVSRDKIGGHSWTQKYEEGGIEYDNITKCVECHTGITKFSDIVAGFDYDMDGTTEPFQMEVEGLLEEIALALPPLGSPDIDLNLVGSDPDSARLKKVYYNYAYVEEDNSKGAHNPKYIIGLLQVSLSNLTGVDFSGHEPIPSEYVLTQNYPNPFNPTTTMKVGMAKAGDVRVEVFNVLGARVATLMNGTYPPGVFDVSWDGKDASGRELAGGIYIYRMQTDGFTSVKKMILLK